MDHTQVLGNSLFEIAREKAGVMRAGKSVVIGKIPKEVREFLVQAAYLQKSQPILAATPQGSNQEFSYDSFQKLQLKLEGNHQLSNAAVVIEILKILNHSGFSWKENELREGLSRARNPGRLEWIEGKPSILLDGAHNLESMEALAKYLKKHLSQKKLTVIFGMMVDKEVLPILKLLKDFNPKWIFTQINHPRSRTVSQLQEISDAWKLGSEIYANSSMALNAAKEQTPLDGIILVTGSLYLVGELHSALQAWDSAHFL
jgi:dihydrofolate synthase/folylpolyglutamate synthase